MAASPRRRDDRLKRMGIVPGMTLRISYVAGEAMEECTTLVEEVTPDRIGVAVPIFRLRERPLPRSVPLWAAFTFRERQWRFVTYVVGRSPAGDLQYLAAPEEVESADRRRYFRLPTALRPASLFRLVLEANDATVAPEIDGTVVDLSEGGCCISTRDDAVRAGELLGIELELPHVGRIVGRLRVVSIDEPTRQRRNRRLHCEFIGASLSMRDRIARYVIRRQLEMRRRGQL